VYDESKTVDSTIEMPVQINGKVRAVVNVPKDASKDDILAIAKAEEKVSSAIDGKTVIKEISIPNKIINIVVK
jgi:leucyl-tRNA synthetase